MPRKGGGSIPGPGYEGKGFMAAGNAAMQQALVKNWVLLGSAITRKGTRAPPRVIVRDKSPNPSGIGYQLRVTSNLSRAAKDFRRDLIAANMLALRLAGEAGVDAAREAYGISTPLTPNSPWPTRIGTPDDNTDIPENITFDVFSSGNVFGVELKAKTPSIKMLRQELGMWPGE